VALATELSWDDMTKESQRELERIIGEAVGLGSVCWENMHGTGAFQVELASKAVDHAVSQIKELLRLV
jgi:hypothetical protein